MEKEIRLPRKGHTPKINRRKSKLETKEREKSGSPKGVQGKTEQANILNVPENVSNECRDAIEQMLRKDPDERISLFDLQHHPWLCNYQHANKQMWEETSNESGSNASNELDK